MFKNSGNKDGLTDGLIGPGLALGYKSFLSRLRQSEVAAVGLVLQPLVSGVQHASQHAR